MTKSSSLLQAKVQGDYIIITNQYASRQVLVLADEGFVFLGSRGTSLSVMKVDVAAAASAAAAAELYNCKCRY